MAEATPHFVLFETFGRTSAAFAEIVNFEPRQQLQSLLDVPLGNGGRFVLLRAPRAGHGKTHLMSRIQQHFGGSHEFLPIYPVDITRIDAATSLVDVLRRLTRPLPNNASGLSTLDVLVRKIFATGFEPLVASGEVPSEDRAAALDALRNRPIDTFDFHHEQAVTAIWTRDHFDMLSSRITLELARRANTPIRETAWWVERLFKFAVTPLSDATRVGAIIKEAQDADSGTMLESLGALLSLLALVVRVVLVCDDLEGFAANPPAALKLASYLATLRQCAERVDAIIAINYDVWDNAFIPGLSGGLIDRLLERVIDLRPLDRKEIVALLEAHAPGQGDRLMDRVPVYVTHPRGVLHSASVEPEVKEETAKEAKPALPQAAFEAVPLTSPVPLTSGEPLPEVAPATIAKPLPKPVSVEEIAAQTPVEAKPPLAELVPAVQADVAPAAAEPAAVEPAAVEKPHAPKLPELKTDKVIPAKPEVPERKLGAALFKVEGTTASEALKVEKGEGESKPDAGLPAEQVVLPEKVISAEDKNDAEPAAPKPLTEDVFAEEADSRKQRGQANIVIKERVRLPSMDEIKEIMRKAEEAHIQVAQKPIAPPKSTKLETAPVSIAPREKTQEELDAEFFALLEGKPLPPPSSDKQPTALTAVPPRPIENDTMPVSLADLETRMKKSAEIKVGKPDTAAITTKPDAASGEKSNDVDKLVDDLRKRTGDV